MSKPAFDVICITDVPRHSVANALQVQARTDYADAIRAVRFAFKHAQNLVAEIGDGARHEQLRDAIASARLEVNAACDAFAEQVAAVERLYQAGIDLQQDEEPEPPKEEVPQNA